MDEEIFVTYNPGKKTEYIECFKAFKKKFNYFEDIKLKFTPDEKYNLYEKDLQDINSGMPELVSLIDTRDLPENKDEPIRMLLRDKFLKIDDEEKNEHILHEIGHFITNPSLKKIRQYISKNSPDKIIIQKPKYQQLIDFHNKGLTYLLDLLKLPQEVNADLWIYENEPKYSETRFKRYCDGVNTTFIENDKRKFFYIIPFLNFHLIYRYSTINKIDFKIKNECLEKVDKANERLYELAQNLGWGSLKQLKYQNDILKSIEYKNPNYRKLIQIYEELFKEYIQISSSFFPRNYQDEILKIYL